MKDFPIFAVVFKGLDFDLAGALSSPGLRAAGFWRRVL